MTRSFHSLFVALVLVLAVTLAGCFGAAQVTSPAASHNPPADTIATGVPIDSVAPAPVTPTAVLAPVMLDIHSLTVAVAADSAVIDGAAGGTISNGVVRIDVPGGAFNGIATIGFAMSDPNTMQAEIHITPDSLNHFAKPVRLRFLCQGKSAGAATGVFWFEPTKAQWYGLTSSVYDSTGDDVSVNVRHFSRYGAGGRAGW
jgi:hypothetical protein